MKERMAILVPASLGANDMRAAIELLKETFEVEKALPATFNMGIVYPIEINAPRKEVEEFMDATGCIEWL